MLIDIPLPLGGGKLQLLYNLCNKWVDFQKDTTMATSWRPVANQLATSWRLVANCLATGSQMVSFLASGILLMNVSI